MPSDVAVTGFGVDVGEIVKTGTGEDGMGGVGVGVGAQAVSRDRITRLGRSRISTL